MSSSPCHSWITWLCRGSCSSLRPKHSTKHLIIIRKTSNKTDCISLTTNVICCCITQSKTVNTEVEAYHKGIRRIFLFYKSSPIQQKYKKTRKGNRHLIFKGSSLESKLIPKSQARMIASCLDPHLPFALPSVPSFIIVLLLFQCPEHSCLPHKPKISLLYKAGWSLSNCCKVCSAKQNSYWSHSTRQRNTQAEE